MEPVGSGNRSRIRDGRELFQQTKILLRESAPGLDEVGSGRDRAV
jgi:hypothetical protein